MVGPSRAPQSQGSVFETISRDAPQGIGIGQRDHRRPHRGGDDIGEEYQRRLGLRANQRKTDGGHDCRHDYRAAQRGVAFGKASHERQDRKSRQRRNRGDDADPGRLNADRAQP